MEAARIVMSGMWLQDAGSLSSGNGKLLVIFMGILAFSVLVLTLVVVIMALVAAVAGKRLLGVAEEFRTKAFPVFERVGPMVDGVSELVRDSSPKIKVITENCVEASHIIRDKAREFDVTASDLNSKTRAQAARVDGMVTSVLNTTAEITDSIQRGIKIPVREVTGLVNGLKAGLEVLVGRAKAFGGGRMNVPRDRDPGW